MGLSLLYSILSKSDSFVKAHYEILVISLGVFGYDNAKRTFSESIAPKIIPVDIDFKKHTITVKNVGKGLAQQVQLPRFANFIDFFGRYVQGLLIIDHPETLAADELKVLETRGLEDGKPLHNGLD